MIQWHQNHFALSIIILDIDFDTKSNANDNKARINYHLRVVIICHERPFVLVYNRIFSPNETEFH